MIRYLYVFLVAFLFPKALYATTPADVFYQVQIVISQVEVLKKNSGSTVETRVPGIQIGKTPSHAYGKALELLEKIHRYQVQEGKKPLELPQYLNGRVKPANVIALVELAKSELLILLESKKIQFDPSKIIKEEKSKTPSDVYEAIWQASYLMDALVKPITPAEVIRNMAMIEMALKNIAQKKNKKIILPDAQTFTDKKPVDVTIQLYKLLYKLARFERKIGIKPLIVPAFPAGKVKPEDAYDATGNVLADMNRISVALKVAVVKRLPVPQGKVTPNDVYAQVLRINAGAQQLLEVR